ncbi:MAG TPA: hypothetical protein VI893_10155 [Thermoplasmata archaeon]|nr:hypothetical protein [Thermoplasmata archaeon]
MSAIAGTVSVLRASLPFDADFLKPKYSVSRWRAILMFAGLLAAFLPVAAGWALEQLVWLRPPPGTIAAVPAWWPAVALGAGNFILFLALLLVGRQSPFLQRCEHSASVATSVFIIAVVGLLMPWYSNRWLGGSGASEWFWIGALFIAVSVIAHSAIPPEKRHAAVRQHLSPTAH